MNSLWCPLGISQHHSNLKELPLCRTITAYKSDQHQAPHKEISSKQRSNVKSGLILVSIKTLAEAWYYDVLRCDGCTQLAISGPIAQEYNQWSNPQEKGWKWEHVNQMKSIHKTKCCRYELCIGNWWFSIVHKSLDRQCSRRGTKPVKPAQISNDHFRQIVTHDWNRLIATRPTVNYYSWLKSTDCDSTESKLWLLIEIDRLRLDRV